MFAVFPALVAGADERPTREASVGLGVEGNVVSA